MSQVNKSRMNKDKLNGVKKASKKAWIIGVLCVVIVIGGFIALANFLTSSSNEGKTAAVTNGSKAPGFTLESTKGNLSLSGYKGKNVVIFFYESNGCQACLEQLSSLNDKLSEYAKHDTQVLAITTDTLDISKQYVQKLDINIPVLYDPNHRIGDKYGVYNVPGGMDMGPVDTHSIFIIDKNGDIQWHQVSPQKMYISQESIDQQLQKLWE